MKTTIDFSIANSGQIARELSERIEAIRLMRNLTQSQLASAAGISVKTLGRMERGEDVSLDTFIRVLIAMGLHHNLKTLLPEVSVRPVERIRQVGIERKRARPFKKHDAESTWTWGDESEVKP